MSEPNVKKRTTSLLFLLQSAIIAAIYLMATFFTSLISFGMIQFRIAEALAALAILIPGAIPGLFIGCLLANLLNPASLGPVDILGGSLATGISALLTYRLGRNYRGGLKRYLNSKDGADLPKMRSRLLPLLAPVFINALIVGTYLPFIIQGKDPSIVLVLFTMLSIFLSQAVAVYGLGLPLLLALERTPVAVQALKEFR